MPRADGCTVAVGRLAVLVDMCTNVGGCVGGWIGVGGRVQLNVWVGGCRWVSAGGWMDAVGWVQLGVCSWVGVCVDAAGWCSWIGGWGGRVGAGGCSWVQLGERCVDGCVVVWAGAGG